MDSIIIKRGLRNEHRLTDWQENLSSFTHKHEEVPVNTFRCTDLGYKARWQPLLLVSLEVFDLEQRSYLLSALTQSHGRTFTLAVSPSHTHTHMYTIMGAGCVEGMWLPWNASFICLTSAARPVESGQCVRLPPFIPSRVPLQNIHLLLYVSVEH